MLLSFGRPEKEDFEKLKTPPPGSEFTPLNRIIKDYSGIADVIGELKKFYQVTDRKWLIEKMLIDFMYSHVLITSEKPEEDKPKKSPF